MAVTAIQKYIDQLSRNPNVQKVVNEFNRLGGELLKKGQELNEKFYSGSEGALEEAHARVQKVVKAVGDAQEQLDGEVNAAVTRIKKSAASVEKGLEAYRKKALAQKVRIEKLLKIQAKNKKTSKKAAPRATKKKATKKTTSKKA